VNLKQKRYAVCSALAASAVPSLLMARGHHVESVPEVPLVLDDSSESITKTAKAVKLLQEIGAYADIEKVKASRNLRSGKGKMRNRRYVQRKGPLVVYANDSGITKAMRNIPGVELCSVDRLGLLTLAPGGHVGRFIIWTKSAFEKLDAIYGTSSVKSSAKKGWKPPTNIMAQSDLSRVINSDEIQSAINAPKEGKNRAHAPMKRNPLKNKSAMDRLNPYAKVAAEMRVKAEAASSAAKAKKTSRPRQGWHRLLRGHEEGVQLRGRALRRFRLLAQGQARGGGLITVGNSKSILGKATIVEIYRSARKFTRHSPRRSTKRSR